MVSIKISLVLVLLLKVYMCARIRCTVTIGAKINRVKDTIHKKFNDGKPMCSMCMTLSLKEKTCENLDNSNDKDLLKALSSTNHIDLMTVENSANFILISNPKYKCDPEQDSGNYVAMTGKISTIKLKDTTGDTSFWWTVAEGSAMATLVYTWEFRKGYKASVSYQAGLKAEAGNTAWCLNCLFDYARLFVSINEETYGSKAAVDAFKKVGEVIWDGTEMLAIGVGVLILGAVVVAASPIILIGAAFTKKDKHSRSLVDMQKI